MKVVIDTYGNYLRFSVYQNGNEKAHQTLKGVYVTEFIIFYDLNLGKFLAVKSRYDTPVSSIVRLIVDVEVDHLDKIIHNEKAMWFFLKYQVGNEPVTLDISDYRYSEVTGHTLPKLLA